MTRSLRQLLECRIHKMFQYQYFPSYLKGCIWLCLLFLFPIQLWIHAPVTHAKQEVHVITIVVSTHVHALYAKWAQTVKYVSILIYIFIYEFNLRYICKNCTCHCELFHAAYFKIHILIVIIEIQHSVKRFLGT